MSHQEGSDQALLAAQLGIEDPELAAAIEASYKTQNHPVPAPPDVIPVEEDDDRELARALELSRMEEERRLAGCEESPRPFPPDVARGSSSAAGSVPPPSVSLLRPPTAPVDEVGSNAAVDGGSSRGSSREGFLGDEVMDPQLAAVLEASYAAQTETARAHEEEDMLRQAMEISRQEEERRQNQALREQQDAELQESLIMDQMREQEEKRRRLEEEELRNAAEAARHAEMQRQEEEERQRVAAHQLRVESVPPEPDADAPNRVDLQIRSPDGKRTRRRFLSSHTLGQVYDYLQVEGFLSEPVEAFQLVSTMPRKEYKDRNETLADAGLQGQCALMLERLTA